MLNVKVDVFEGPLELLCRLVDKHEKNIFDVPIAALTDQFLAHVAELREENPMDDLSAFIAMAAQLLEIKSKLLLPRKAEAVEEEADPREELARRLAEYRRFKEIAAYLSGKEDEGLLRFFRDGLDGALPPDMTAEEPEDKAARLLSNVSLSDLWKALTDCVSRQELKIDRVRAGFDHVERERFSVEEKVKLIAGLLQTAGRAVFERLFADWRDKEEVVTTFLALLELIRSGRALARQDGSFGNIYIEAA